MTGLEFDIIAIGDFRFPGGSSTGAAEQIRAQARAGYRTGLIQVKAPVLKFPHPFNPRIRECLDEGAAVLVDPEDQVKARLALAFHPQIFTHLPSRPLKIDAEHRLLAVCHPLVDGNKEPYYDWADIDRNARHAMGGDVLWAPVGPQVRQPIGWLPDPPALLHYDWLEVIDTKRWSSPVGRPLGPHPVIGRHSRPDPMKWPEDPAVLLAAYPADPRFRVRVLGGGEFLRTLLGGVPPNWELLAFNAEPVRRFLETIDFFVYYHHSAWVEAFGRVIIEAMASGVLPILPHHFETLYGDGAVYAEAEDVSDTVLAFHEDSRAYRDRIELAQDTVQRHFSHAAHVARLADLIGPPGRPQVPAAGPTVIRDNGSGRRVLFVTSNGVGMGHLTRMLAIARRCGPTITPVFVTMSQAMRVVEQFGYLAEFLPFHGYLGADPTLWNHYLRHELNEIISFYRPSVLVFDGNVAYGGLVGALEDNPQCLGIWCRRAMWRPGGATEESITREHAFHAVLEPGELAKDHDAGLTTRYRSRTRLLDPVRLLDESEILDRHDARAELGLAPDAVAVLLQLGSGNNFDYDETRSLLYDCLSAARNVQIFVAQWMIADDVVFLPEGIKRLSTYPIARVLKAFDFTVSACGYNGFHEQIAAGVPAIFIPNENPMMDEQIVRARYAESTRLGLCIRQRDIYALPNAIDTMLDPTFRNLIRSRCQAIPAPNGANEAARFITELTYTVRADMRPRDLWTGG